MQATLFPAGAIEFRFGAATLTDGIVALVGTPWFERDLANACAVCAGGRVQAVYRKHFLPNYGVFDEHRYFQAGTQPALMELNGIGIGLTRGVRIPVVRCDHLDDAIPGQQGRIGGGDADRCNERIERVQRHRQRQRGRHAVLELRPLS